MPEFTIFGCWFADVSEDDADDAFWFICPDGNSEFNEFNEFTNVPTEIVSDACPLSSASTPPIDISINLAVVVGWGLFDFESLSFRSIKLSCGDIIASNSLRNFSF